MSSLICLMRSNLYFMSDLRLATLSFVVRISSTSGTRCASHSPAAWRSQRTARDRQSVTQQVTRKFNKAFRALGAELLQLSHGRVLVLQQPYGNYESEPQPVLKKGHQ